MSAAEIFLISIHLECASASFRVCILSILWGKHFHWGHACYPYTDIPMSITYLHTNEKKVGPKIN